MKLIYCMADVYNPGGMERVLLNKLRWLSARGGYELMLVTTDQNGRPPSTLSRRRCAWWIWA